MRLTPEDPLNPTTLPLPNELGTSGPYYFAVARPAGEMEHVGLHRDGSVYGYFTRPESECPGV